MKKYFKGVKRLDGVQIVSTLLIIAFAIIVIVPFWNAVVISFESKSMAILYPFSWFPRQFTLDNYAVLFSGGSKLVIAYVCTIYMTVLGTLLGMTMCVMAGYGFSRKFPGKKFFLILMLITMFISGGTIPTYLQYKNMGLMNIYGCIVCSLGSVYNVIIMKNGFESVPMDLQEAAMIDGAQDFTIFYKIMLPLQKPLIATFSLFTVVGYWNSWYWPMLMLTRSKATTLQLYLRKIVVNLEPVGDGTASASQLYVDAFTEGSKMAAVFVVMLPIMLVYPFLQKYFTKGIMVGAVKM